MPVTKVAMSHPKARHLLLDAINHSPYTERIDDAVLYIWDVFDDQLLSDIFDRHGTPRYIFADSNSCYQSSLGIEIYSVDYWLEQEIKSKLCRCNLTSETQIATRHAANFVINKKQINRFLTVKLCEIFAVDCDYTWSGIGSQFDLSHVINEKRNVDDPLIDQVFSDLLSPVKNFQKKWIDCKVPAVITATSILNYGSNEHVWNCGLDQLISSTAVSIITESVWTQKAATFSEKTAYAVLGLTFPLWVGGFNMATEWKNKGFDIFDDVIDHNYQTRSTLLERCFYAFELNKRLLTDRRLVHDVRLAYLDRLLENRKRLLDDTIEKYNRSVVDNWPEDLKHVIFDIMKHNHLRH